MFIGFTRFFHRCFMDFHRFVHRFIDLLDFPQIYQIVHRFSVDFPNFHRFSMDFPYVPQFFRRKKTISPVPIRCRSSWRSIQRSPRRWPRLPGQKSWVFPVIIHWLVVWNMAFMTFHILGTIIPFEFHIFSEGQVYHQPV